MNTNVTPRAEDLTSYPISRYECFWNGIFNPYMQQDLHGFVFQNQDTGMYYRLPLTIVFGVYEDFHYYEIIEHLQDPELNRSIRFGSKIELNRNGYPKQLPDSFYRTRAYINSRYPGHATQIEEFLEGLIVNGLLVNEYSDDIGELDIAISELNRQTTRERVESITKPAVSPNTPLTAIQVPYLAKDACLQSTDHGTVRLDQDDNEVGILSDISIRAYIEKDVPMHKGREFCVIHASVPQHDGSVTEMEFRSPNYLPEYMPDAPMMAIEYLQQAVPEQAEIIPNLVIGSVGTVINDLKSTTYLDEGFAVAEEHYRHRNGGRLTSLNTNV